MKQICFLLQVKPGGLDEYKRRPRAVRPEMLEWLGEKRWNNYSLFLRGNRLLVGYLETLDFKRSSVRAGTARREVNGRWQREMKEFFVELSGLLPDRAIQPLEEVFYLP